MYAYEQLVSSELDDRPLPEIISFPFFHVLPLNRAKTRNTFSPKETRRRPLVNKPGSFPITLRGACLDIAFSAHFPLPTPQAPSFARKLRNSLIDPIIPENQQCHQWQALSANGISSRTHRHWSASEDGKYADCRRINGLLPTALENIVYAF